MLVQRYINLAYRPNPPDKLFEVHKILPEDTSIKV